MIYYSWCHIRVYFELNVSIHEMKTILWIYCMNENREEKNTIINSLLKYGRKSQMILFNLLQIIIFTLCLLFVDFTTFSPCLSSLTIFFLVHGSVFFLSVRLNFTRTLKYSD